MMKSFCAGANLKALLQGEMCPDILKLAVPLLEKKWGQDRRQGTMNTLWNLGDVATERLGKGMKTTLSVQEYKGAFDVGFADRYEASWDTSGEMFSATSHKRVAIGGRTFATKDQSSRDSEIYFKALEGDSPVAGIIASIFSVVDGEREVFVLLVYPRKPAPAHAVNPFARYPDFGAEVWSDELEARPICIPTTRRMYHVQLRPWSKGLVVLKPIIPVSPLTDYQAGRDLPFPPIGTLMLQWYRGSSSKFGYAYIRTLFVIHIYVVCMWLYL
jgi:hypothetical protein